MKKMKKLFAVILSLAMVLGMTVTAFAEEPANVKPTSVPITGEPADTDKVDVKISGLTGNPTVTLYQIASAKYDTNDGRGFIRYEWVEANEIDFDAATSGQITDLANAIVNGKLRVPGDSKAGTIDSNGVYTANVKPGAYIAVITGASDGSVYNPILLTATYNSDETTGVELIGGSIDAANADYLNGASAVAKKSTPSIDKQITGGATTDSTITGNTLPDGTNTATNPTENATASVGDRLEYTITPTMPSYPAEARNKKLAVSDRTNVGLTLEFDSLALYIDDTTGKETNKAEKSDADANGVVTFTYEGKVIAYAKEVVENGTTGFDMTFNYDNLIYTNGAVHVPTIKYNAVVNDKAVVGTDGNTNTTTLYYTNQPNTDTDWDPSDVYLPTGEDVEDKTDKETFYTYQLAFHKVGDANDADKAGLAGAVFGIYSDPSCAVGTLVDKVTTDAHGYATSSQVGAGKYYIKEIVAPDGYSLNDDVYEVETTWKTATATITETSKTVRKYTANKVDAVSEEVVGYLDADGNFYNLKTSEDVRKALGLVPAYLLSETTTTTTEKTVLTQETDTTTGIAAILKNMSTGEEAENITNTTLTALPSTGGIGTTIFTIGGCVIMIAAAALFFASRKKSQK